MRKTLTLPRLSRDEMMAAVKTPLGLRLLALALAVVFILGLMAVVVFDSGDMTDDTLKEAGLMNKDSAVKQAAIDGTQLDQRDPSERLRERLDSYVPLMVGIALFVAAAGGLCIWLDRGFLSLIIAFGGLLAVGTSFKFFYATFPSQVLWIWMAMPMFAVMYFVTRSLRQLRDRVFDAIAIAVLVLVLPVQMIFGEEVNGARINIAIGPLTFLLVEPLKFLLVLLGSFAYGSKRRSGIYCVVCLISCLVLVACKELGGTAIVFVTFVLMTYLLYDRLEWSVSIVALAVVALIAVSMVYPHVANRFAGWGKAMENEGSHQYYILRAMVMGGFFGLGVDDAVSFIWITYASEDAALCGVQAIFGVPMVLITVALYAVIILQGAYNSSAFPSCHLILYQVGIQLFAQVLLTYLGACDVLPFTGVTAPLISMGGTSTLVTAAMLGMVAGALDPRIKMKARPMAEKEWEYGTF